MNDLLLSLATRNAVRFQLEPAHSAVQSLVLLTRADEVSGLDEWVYRTAAAMSEDEKSTHRLVVIGLYYAVVPRQSWPSFPAYLEHLSQMSPETMRDKVMEAYFRFGKHADMAEQPTTHEVLADVHSFLRFLRERFDADSVDPELERRAYTYLLDPPALRDLVVGHLRMMWHRFLAVEWERVRPSLQKSIQAFQQVDLSEMTRGETIEYVIGKRLGQDKECWLDQLEKAEELIFVPSLHVGPYLWKFTDGLRHWIIFGARQPEGVDVDAPELDRAHILVRLNALADETRLSILKLVAEEGEMRSQDIMKWLDLSQSAASRHLQQLTAAGFLEERRCNGAKCYQLSGARLDSTLRAIAAYLGQRQN
jgi:ArsR family transcriptional regulator